MKEEEAKTKWCPMVRHVVGNDVEEGSSNRVGLDMNPEITRCIASDCALWVWDITPETVEQTASGHCGLAS